MGYIGPDGEAAFAILKGVGAGGLMEEIWEQNLKDARE